MTLSLIGRPPSSVRSTSSLFVSVPFLTGSFPPEGEGEDSLRIKSDPAVAGGDVKGTGGTVVVLRGGRVVRHGVGALVGVEVRLEDDVDAVLEEERFKGLLNGQLGNDT